MTIQSSVIFVLFFIQQFWISLEAFTLNYSLKLPVKFNFFIYNLPNYFSREVLFLCRVHLFFEFDVNRFLYFLQSLTMAARES